MENNFVPTLKPNYWYGPYIDPKQEAMLAEASVGETTTTKTTKGKQRKTKTKKKAGKGSFTNFITDNLHKHKKQFSADRDTFYIIGAARLRQLRVKRGEFLSYCVFYKAEPLLSPISQQLYDSKTEMNNHQVSILTLICHVSTLTLIVVSPY